MHTTPGKVHEGDEHDHLHEATIQALFHEMHVESQSPEQDEKVKTRNQLQAVLLGTNAAVQSRHQAQPTLENKPRCDENI
jgi:hypothetical protein